MLQIIHKAAFVLIWWPRLGDLVSLGFYPTRDYRTVIRKVKRIFSGSSAYGIQDELLRVRVAGLL